MIAAGRPSPALVAHLTEADRLGLLAGEVVEGELLDAPDPHELSRTVYPWGIAVACACGLWECVVTGPSSAAWAERDHDRHRRVNSCPPG